MSHHQSRRLMQKVFNKLLKKWQAGCIYYWSHDLSSNYFMALKIAENLFFSLLWALIKKKIRISIRLHVLHESNRLHQDDKTTDRIYTWHAVPVWLQKKWQAQVIKNHDKEGNWKSQFKLSEILRQHLPQFVLLFVVLASLIQEASADLSNEIAATMPQVAG